MKFNPHPRSALPRSGLSVALSLIVSGWLMLVQPGLSHYWLIDPHIHAEIDEALYGQTPDGETLPGHESHAPHQHPVNLGIIVSAPLLIDPFGAEFYRAVFAPATSPALCRRCLGVLIVAKSISLAPPEQPPRL